MSSFADRVASQIPSSVRMISGCHDKQTSADANITAFQLPNPAGRQGGACTAALLQVLYNKHPTQSDSNNYNRAAGMSWVDVLREMRQNLDSKGYSQVPQLSSSKIINVNEPMTIVENPTGVKRAVLIGINYVGQQGQLSGCHNDVRNIQDFLQRVHGFQQHNMTVLMDDGRHKEPTYANIMAAFDWIVKESMAGDTVWIHYSGHGGRVADQDGDEDDGYDETLIPVDFQRKGQIRDDDLLKHLVKPMRKGVVVTALMDCCHSGTVLDLPYRFIADGDQVVMERNEAFDLGHVIGIAVDVMRSIALVAGATGAVGAGDFAENVIDECCVIL